MRYLITADWHISTTRVLPENILINRYHRLFDSIISVYRKYKADYLLILGDLFDKPRPTDAEIHLFLTLLNQLDNLNIPTIITTGNHEALTHYKSSHRCFVPLSDKYKNITITADDITRKQLGEDYWVFLPYSSIKNDVDITTSEFTRPEGTSNYFLATHARGNIDKYNVREEYPFSRFKNSDFDKVFLGDIHVGHEIQPNVFYPGAPLDIQFGHSCSGTVIIFDSDNDTVDYLDLCMPILESASVKASELIPFIQKGLNSNNTKIYVTGDRGEIDSVFEEASKLVDKLNSKNNNNIFYKLVSKPNKLEIDMESRVDYLNTEEGVEGVGGIESLSTEELEVYLNYTKVDDKNLISDSLATFSDIRYTV